MTTSRALKAILFSFLFTIFGSSVAKTIEIKSPFISVPSSMKGVVLFHDEDGFHVSQNNEIFSVEKCWIDLSLQNISSEDLQEFLVTGYICISQMDNGEFSLQAKNLIKGGGLIGAAVGAWTGRFVAFAVVGAGVIIASIPAAIVGGPGAGFLFAGALAKTIAPVVLPVVHAVTIGTAIAVGTFTGLV
ncbi:hypothetical protein KAH94_01210 [bacterium]|nr:hypothetical protein [bacterium]